MTILIPAARGGIASNGSPPAREWYRFFQQVQASLNDDGLSKKVADISVRVYGLESGPSGATATKITGTGSIYVTPSDIQTISLSGDADAPGFTTYYGTNSLGDKGFFAVFDTLSNTADVTLAVGAGGITTIGLADLADSGTGALVAITRDAKGRVSGTRAATITGTAGRVMVANGTAAAGLPTIDLATVTDAGGGVLQKTAFDTYGRKTGTSAATTTDLTEGTNLYFTNARVLATILAGLSTVTNAAITAADSALVALGKLQAQVTARVLKSGDTMTGPLVLTANPTLALQAAPKQYVDAIIPPGHIDGLKMVWASATAITVASGSAYIQSAGVVLYSPVAIAKAGLVLTASTWYHVYLYSNAGTPDVEIVTTAPDTAYNGTARSKTGDASRRYVGSVRTDASGAMFSFITNGSLVSYREDVANGVFRILNAGTSTAEASVSCTAVIPATANIGLLNFISTTTSGGAIRSGLSDDNFTGTGNKGIAYVRPQAASLVTHPLDSSQAFTYWFDTTPSGGGAYINVLGYTYER